ncbi:MAG TPA: DUF3187 family protein [Gammaproteobacteria bacterium]|nr:DUF3187 family protein [Gammaproteobacteria bacterium]
MPNIESCSFRTVCILLGGLLCNPAYPAPLLTVDQNPLTAIYGLPLPQDARIPQAGSGAFTTSANFSSMMIIDASSEELLFMDGETHRLNLILDQGLSRDWSLRLLLPWIEHVPGFMDRPIDRFHEIFGLSAGERPTQPRDRLLYSIQRNGDQLLYVDSERSGMGDLQLILNRQLRRSDRSAWSLAGGVKAPTGDSAQLTGSGSADASVWTAGWWRLEDDMEASASAGLLFPGESDVLTRYQTNQVAFGHAGLQWQVWQPTMVKLQLDWHTRFYENMDSAFVGDVLQLSFGGAWRPSENTGLDFTLTEDIKVDASPDATFNISLRMDY